MISDDGLLKAAGNLNWNSLLVRNLLLLAITDNIIGVGSYVNMPEKCGCNDAGSEHHHFTGSPPIVKIAVAPWRGTISLVRL